MISRNTLCGPILPKIKKMEELLIFDQNHGLTPLQKCNFFLNFLLLLPVVYEGVSFFPISTKIKTWKIANFWPKQWTKKIPVFRLLPVTVFTVFKGVFLSKVLWNKFSLPILPKIKRMEQLLIFDQDHGLSPFEKSQFFDFF